MDLFRLLHLGQNWMAGDQWNWWSVSLDLLFHPIYIPSQIRPLRTGTVSLCEVKCFGESALVSIIHNYPAFCTQLLLQNPIAMSWIMREPSLSLFSRILKWVDCHLKKDNIFYPRVNVHEPSRTEPPTSSESFKCTHQHAKNVADAVSKLDKMGAGKCTFTSLSKFEFGLFRPNINAQLQGMV